MKSLQRLVAVAFATLSLSMLAAAPIAVADCQYGAHCCPPPTPHNQTVCKL
jgi:hypothetical protein